MALTPAISRQNALFTSSQHRAFLGEFVGPSMPLQNRVTPCGEIIVNAARGGLMGNRGILHDEHRQVHKTHSHQNWVSCALSFNGNKRQLMSPGKYTELFFLDEATALAAGHRPCATCRRARYNEFTKLWQSLHGGPEVGRSLPHSIDKTLHRARIKHRRKVTFEAVISDLPDGVMVSAQGQTLLKWQGQCHRWSFLGYDPDPVTINGPVTVLTPRPIIAVLTAGYKPDLHASLARP